jgi:hypothetical protein
MVLEHAISDPDLRDALVTLFNDKDEAHCKSLEQVDGQLEHAPDELDVLARLPAARRDCVLLATPKRSSASVTALMRS